MGSMVKIEEEWNSKEKGDGFGANEDLQNDLFYLSMNWMITYILYILLNNGRNKNA